MQTKLEKKVFYLQAYCLIITLFVGSLLVMGFSQSRKQKFGEIDVERINIVEKDGKLKMVISNQERQQSNIVDGKILPLPTGGRPAGIIFFNHLGNEMGGLVYGENGGKGQFGSFTFDKVNQNETIGFRHLESDNGQYASGLWLWERPNISINDINAKRDIIKKMPDEAARKAAFQKLDDEGEFGADRMFFGKYRNDTAMISLADKKGKPRIEISVKADGTPKINFLDETGKVTYSLPETPANKK